MVPRRRRGPLLESAILDAVIAELSRVGWADLTMEGVAAGAATGKSAIYRRWPSKESLVAAALRHALPERIECPELGTARDELLVLALSLHRLMTSPYGIALRAVLEGCDAVSLSPFARLFTTTVAEPAKRCARMIVRRSGHTTAHTDTMADMAVEAVLALLLYRPRFGAGPLAERELRGLVDDVILPVVGA
ncbi:TetR/AcrR family transcriptional regulator [Streptomyces coacervatus]|uniref:TetR/AcrR family transcriptional regulator n=1 Tax=Streptomyces coacervatus TaxID=647381 RepID=A0ABP7HWV0_9ACTN|nr:TetR/AcrR family transcriptional regulator [Streptomyces coacervatus]MDF2267178.1 TetR/AcrR family transcriptional regulator [Streptomyces coacervatus]